MIMRVSDRIAVERADEPIPFPIGAAGGSEPVDRRIDDCFGDLSRRIDENFDTLSRRIDDLARELNCLGYFDDGPDLPRAA